MSYDHSMPMSSCSYCGSQRCSNDCQDSDDWECPFCHEPERDERGHKLTDGTWICDTCHEAGFVDKCANCCLSKVPLTTDANLEKFCAACVQQYAG